MEKLYCPNCGREGDIHENEIQNKYEDKKYTCGHCYHQFNTPKECYHCKGRGTHHGAMGRFVPLCPHCKGTGILRG